jgi:hypothetical protein
LEGLPFALQGSLLLNFFFPTLFLLESGLDHGLVYRVRVAAMRAGYGLLAYGTVAYRTVEKRLCLFFLLRCHKSWQVPKLIVSLSSNGTPSCLWTRAFTY